MEKQKSFMRIFIATVIGLLMLIGSAQAVLGEERAPSLTARVESDTFYVSGVWEADKNITILTMDAEGNIVYVDQEKTDAEGDFSFIFLLPKSAENGTYLIRVGGENIAKPIEMQVEYAGAPARVNANVLENCVTVSGCLYTGEEKAVTILVRDPFGEIIYIDQDETDAESTYSFTFLLPPSASNGNYMVFVGGEGIDTPYTTSFTFSSALKPIEITQNERNIKVSGCLRTGKNKAVTILVQSPKGNIAYIDQTDSDVNGLYSFDFMIPSSFSNGEYKVLVGGEDIETPFEETFVYNMGVNAARKSMVLQNIEIGKERILHIYGQNVSDLKSKTFMLEYNTSELAIEDLCVYTYEKERLPGKCTGTNISVTDWNEEKGQIHFTVNVDNGNNKWNGALNGFRFVGKKNCASEVTLEMCGGK